MYFFADVLYDRPLITTATFFRFVTDETGQELHIKHTHNFNLLFFNYFLLFFIYGRNCSRWDAKSSNIYALSSNIYG